MLKFIAIQFKSNLSFDFSIWIDGTSFRRYHLLVAGLKPYNFSVFNDKSENTSKKVFILEIWNLPENTLNLEALEENLTSQILSLDSTFLLENQKIEANFKGFVCDHAIRQKILKMDDKSSRCGECTFIFDKNHFSNDLYFLDFKNLLMCEEINSKNYFHERRKFLPQSTLQLFSIKDSLMTHDNLHNFGNHVKKVFISMWNLVNYSSLSKKKKKELIFFILSKVKIICGVRLDAKKFPRFGNIKFAEWRTIGLNLSKIFDSSLFCSPLIYQSFLCLFSILNEIHIFQYYNFNRKEKDFHHLKSRYVVILYMYTIQLSKCFQEALY